MTVVELLAAAVAVTVGAAVTGAVGFGVNVVAAPVLAVIDPRLVPGPALAVGFVLTVLVSVRDRRWIDRRGVRFNLAGRVPGTVLGALLVASIPKEKVTITVGVAVLLAVVLNVTRVTLRPNPPTLVAAGVVSGFASTVSAVGGPPTAVVYANEPGPVARATLAFIFLIGSAMSLTALVVVGDFGRHEAGAAAVLLGPTLLGFLLSKRVAARVDRGATRNAVLIVAVLGAITALAKELL